jgi:hypothetical protein
VLVLEEKIFLGAAKLAGDEGTGHADDIRWEDDSTYECVSSLFGHHR